MFEQYCLLFLSFFFYSMAGYLVEITCCSLIEKKLVLNRGFCLGPYLPLYGISSVLMIHFLNAYREDWFVLFVMAAFICTLMEYGTSFLLEKIFKARWWDYSEKKFNIAGRVCLENSLLFGLGGVLIVAFVNPFFQTMLTSLNTVPLYVLTLVLFVLFCTDVIVTVITLCQVKIASIKFKNRDVTSELSRIVRGEIIKNKTLVRRMLEAFPKINIHNQKDPLGKVKIYLEKRSKSRKERSVKQLRK